MIAHSSKPFRPTFGNEDVGATWAWGWRVGGTSGFLPPTKDANEKSQDAKRFKRRSKVKESERVLDLSLIHI